MQVLETHLCHSFLFLLFFLFRIVIWATNWDGFEWKPIWVSGSIFFTPELCLSISSQKPTQMSNEDEQASSSHDIKSRPTTNDKPLVIPLFGLYITQKQQHSRVTCCQQHLTHTQLLSKAQNHKTLRGKYDMLITCSYHISILYHLFSWLKWDAYY